MTKLFRRFLLVGVLRLQEALGLLIRGHSGSAFVEKHDQCSFDPCSNHRISNPRHVTSRSSSFSEPVHAEGSSKVFSEVAEVPWELRGTKEFNQLRHHFLNNVQSEPQLKQSSSGRGQAPHPLSGHFYSS